MKVSELAVRRNQRDSFNRMGEYHEWERSIEMSDYLCLTLLSQPGESESAFKARLSEFWTHLLRQHPADFEKVYAEKSAFERKGDHLSRTYLIEADSADAIVRQVEVRGMAVEPVDPDDVYSKYEAAPPEWFWIEH